MSILKKYRWFLLLFIVWVTLFIFNQKVGWEALQITSSSLVDMLLLLPPILVFVGLLDIWVPKETMMKYTGKNSGFFGLLIVFMLGTIAAGPLYVAFPIAALLLKKGTRVRNVVFFLGVWTTAKLPIMIYETVSLGLTFTLIHILFGLLFFYIVGMIMEKMFEQKTLLKYDISA